MSPNIECTLSNPKYLSLLVASVFVLIVYLLGTAGFLVSIVEVRWGKA